MIHAWTSHYRDYYSRQPLLLDSTSLFLFAVAGWRENVRKRRASHLSIFFGNVFPAQWRMVEISMTMSRSIRTVPVSSLLKRNKSHRRPVCSSSLFSVFIGETVIIHGFCLHLLLRRYGTLGPLVHKGYSWTSCTCALFRGI